MGEIGEGVRVGDRGFAGVADKGGAWVVQSGEGLDRGDEGTGE